MARASNLHERISDYSRCPQCVSDARLGYASCYFNADDVLFAVCSRHATKWIVTGRALLHPAVPDLSRYSAMIEAFDQVEPVMPTTADHRPKPDRPSAARSRASVQLKPISAAGSRPRKTRAPRPASDAPPRIASPGKPPPRPKRRRVDVGTVAHISHRVEPVPTVVRGFTSPSKPQRVLIDRDLVS